MFWLANTSKNKSALDEINSEINHWFIDNFKNSFVCCRRIYRMQCR